MLVARRPLSLGEGRRRCNLDAGDVVPREVQEALPPGRIEQLKRGMFVEEITQDSAVEARLDQMEDRLGKLERKLNAQPKRQEAV